MTLNLIRRATAALVLCGSSLGASAALVLAGSGNTVNFYYDDSFWTSATATVSGDSITFALTPGLVATATGTGSDFQDANSAVGTAALVVVAKNGFSLPTSDITVSTSLLASYGLAPSGGSSSVVGGASVHAGSFATGAFASLGSLGDVVADAALVSDQIGEQSGLFSVAEVAFNGNATGGNAVGLFDVFYASFAQQDGTGTSFAKIDSVSYAISAFAVNQVPEPGSLALLLAALGAAALTRRQRSAGAQPGVNA